ncbi:HlyD family efflux transporter periplasmic adaptor subunit [Alteromonas sp. 5E99-2]|uniref:HlyD family secretion protein n=1 Tax=Alteromonas sp. 5E99-2 TaxID=2817683 RepID=UPI001A982F9E|nr:HlyD family efflux transporter periplasmic adaptor subunit [Alteromonas sp. 5E99-2]MBO1256938.1 HlyD family efflux transporter periplasmic adaptor subunit [Alteromonas sp. 5E99-2]
MDISSTKGLFREQAVNHMTNNLLGKVLVVPKTSATWISLFLIFWATITLVWICTAQYAKQVTVSGWLEPNIGVTNHFSALSNGIVSDIFITPEQYVEKGQPLLRITSERRNFAGEMFNQLIKEELLQKRKLLNEELSRLTIQYTKKQDFLSSQQRQLNEEYSTLAEVQLSTRQQYDLAEKYAEKMTLLHKKGWVSDIDLNSASSQSLQLKTQLGNLNREVSQLDKQYQSIVEEITLLPSSNEQSKNQISQEIAEINQRIIQLDAADSEIVFAKKSGLVSDIYVHKGKRVDEKPLLTIVPQNIEFTAMIPVPTQSAGFIKEGQPISIRYDAYPHEKFGTHEGVIDSISDSILLPNEVNNAATTISAPVYMVKARLNTTQIYAYGESVPLKSGNTFTADVTLGERTVIEWLFEPLLSLKGRL